MAGYRPATPKRRPSKWNSLCVIHKKTYEDDEDIQIMVISTSSFQCKSIKLSIDHVAVKELIAYEERMNARKKATLVKRHLCMKDC